MPETLNFTDAASYQDAVDWIRSNVVLRNTTKGPVLQLDITFPRTQVTVFMNPSNHYILAFRGADGIYVLDDPSDTPKFLKDLSAATDKGTKITLLKGFNASHTGVRGIQTFDPNLSDYERNFRSSDFDKITQLTAYREKGNYHPLRKPLSLLVCMISESARFPMMQKDFMHMYMHTGASVLADEAVQSYSNAKELRALAFKIFPNYRSPEAIAKLQNRTNQLQTLLEDFLKLAKTTSSQTLIASILTGDKQPWEGSNTNNTDTFRGMCKELSLGTPSQVTGLISLCDNEMAFRAAKQGVALPGIDG